jgi:serine/threonine-protein kinase
MDIINEEIWNIVQHYLTDDIDSLSDIKSTLAKLREDYPEYYDQIAELLNSKDSANIFFSQLQLNLTESLKNQGEILPENYKIGSYTIRSLISEGGMANVYLADRIDGDFNQQVAVKVLKQHLSNDLVAGQFQKEKQILANLNHPNIAKIYDGGITGQGHPYFIMEYIDGEPITNYCDRKKLSIKERLHLFLHICEAVNYAHSNLIIHKDLKPNNILVDSNGYIKLMDFGVAHTIEESRPYSSESGLKAYTPLFASPEQLNNQNLTTASDVYQLGLVLNNLLIGVMPIDLSCNPKDGIYKSFTKNLDNHQQLQILEKRKLKNARSFNRIIKGDLGSVINKTLKKEPKERYYSVQELREDILRYFEHMPLKSRNQSFNYRFQKFLKRNETILQSGVMFLFLILLITTAYLYKLSREKEKARENARIAKQEAQRAENISSYLKDIISMFDPYNKTAQPNTVDNLLTEGYSHLQNRYALQPRTKADILITMAEVFRKRGNLDKSFKALYLARNIKNSFYPGDHPEMGKIYSQLAAGFIVDNEIDSAWHYISLSLKLDSTSTSNDQEKLFNDLEIKGRLQYYSTRYKAALNTYKTVLKERKKHQQLDNPTKKAALYSSIGDTYHQLSHYDSAVVYLQKALKIHSSIFDSPNGHLIDDYQLLATTYLRLEALDSAEIYVNKALTDAEILYGPKSGELEYILAIASRIAKKKLQFDKALKYAKKALKLNKTNFGRNHIYTAQRMNTVGLVYRVSGQMALAEYYFRKSLNIKEKYYPKEIKSIYIGKYNLAVTLLKQYKTREALNMLKKVRKYDLKIYPEGHPYRAYTLIQMARGFLDSGKNKEAFNCLQKACRITESKFEPVHSRRAECYLLMAEYYTKEQKWDKVNHFASKGMVIYEELYGKKHWLYSYTSALSSLSKAFKSLKFQEINEIFSDAYRKISEHPYANRYFINKLKIFEKQTSSLPSLSLSE